MTPKELRRAIEEAFQDAEYPGDDCIADTGDLGEIERIGEMFNGQRWLQWKDSPSRLWGGKGHIGQCICLFSEYAFRYYAPLFMLALLFEYEEAAPTLGADFLLLMSPVEDDSGLQRRHERRMRAFSRRQLEAIVEFLKYLKEAHDDNVFGEHPSSVIPCVLGFLAEKPA